MNLQRGFSPLIVVILALVLIGLAGGAYYLVSKIPSGLRLSGPGGCKGPDCQTYCRQNPQDCAKWCEENQTLCNLLMGGAFVGTVANPPKTKITFAKTFNMITDLVTEEDIIRAKNLGANMVTLWPAVIFQDNKISFFSQRGNLKGLINTAHKNGLQVELRSSYPVGSEVTDYETFRSETLKYVGEFAQFGQENKVYRIIPFGEIDNHLLKRPEKITELSRELLQEARKHYQGQIGIGIAAPWRDSGYSFAGYDYMTISAYPQSQTDAFAWLTEKPEINVHNVISGARSVAQRSGIQTLHLGETGVFNPGEVDPQGFQTAVISKEKEAEFYDKLFEIVSDDLQGLSVFYGNMFMSIKGDPAEEVVKEWFSRL